MSDLKPRVWLVGADGEPRERAQTCLQHWDVEQRAPFPVFDAEPAPELVLIVLGQTAGLAELQSYCAWRAAFRVPAWVILGTQICAEARAWLHDEEAHPRIAIAAVLDLSDSDSALFQALEQRFGAPTGAARAESDAWRARFEKQCALVEVGDYFRILGLDATAPVSALREAYAHVRRDFDIKTCKHARPQDMAALRSIREVLDEAYAILRDPVRRERYRAALRAAPADDILPP